ncbi:MAG: lysophospholipid acyltransferase family protein [Myxococcota bacterium]
MPSWLRAPLGLSAGALSFVYLIGVLNPIQMLSVFVRPFSKPAFRTMNRWCARSVWGLWVVMAERQNGTVFRFTGDAARPGENAVLLPNHQSMADVLVVLAHGWRMARLGDMKWFVKDVVKWVPGPGWGMKFLDCIFLKRNWAEDQGEIERLFGKFKQEDIPICLVSFLEGTRKTPKKHAAARAFAESRGLPVTEHVMVPRTKGFVATMQGLRAHIDSVQDLTIAYPEGVPGLVDCFAGKPRRIDIHVRRYPVSELPTDEEELTRWTYERFQEKDALLQAHREQGAFPGAVTSGPVRTLDWLKAEPKRRCPVEA